MRRRAVSRAQGSIQNWSMSLPDSGERAVPASLPPLRSITRREPSLFESQVIRTRLTPRLRASASASAKSLVP